MSYEAKTLICMLRSVFGLFKACKLLPGTTGPPFRACEDGRPILVVASEVPDKHLGVEETFRVKGLRD